MTKKIYKYAFLITGSSTIDMPLMHDVVHVGFDPLGIPCIWASVNPDDETVPTVIYVIGTGHPLPESSEHLGSFIDGQFVWHIYRSTK